MKDYSIERIPHKVWGRTGRSRSPLALFWTGSALELRIRGAEAYVDVETDYDTHELWIDILVDEVLTQRMMLPKGRSRVCLFRSMNPRQARTVRIIRDTPAMALDTDPSNLLLIRSVSTDGEFERVPVRSMKIEFIGDSLTSGEGCCGASGYMDWNSGCFSAVESYPFYLSQMLDAEYNVISQSGWGAAFSFRGERREAIPPYYRQVCGLLQGEKTRRLGAADPWDFDSWQPDIVIVNLGTNDGNAINEAAFNARQTRMRKEFQNAVVSFLGELRACNPQARIVWAYGMLGDEMEELIIGALRKYYDQTGDPVTYYQLDNTEVEEFGSRDHPGPDAHRRTAELLLELIEEL